MRALYRIARTRVGSRLLGVGLRLLPAMMRGDRLYESPQLLAFRHPRPAYEVHVLLVPKRRVPTLLDLDSPELVGEVLRAAAGLVAELGLEARGWRLIVNGGPYQDVPHLHFHLVSGNPWTGPLPEADL